MPYRHIRVSPLSGPPGAEVDGADLRELDGATFEEVRSAFLAHEGRPEIAVIAGSG